MPITKIRLAKFSSYYNRDNNNKTRTTSALILVFLTTLFLTTNARAQTPPPSIGEETKGTPAFEETAPLPKTENTATENTEETSEQDEGTPFLGTAKITELRRENGQVYEIELDHSLGGKQYIHESDSDGKIESKSDDIEEAPNLPKWKLGSW